MLEFSEGFVFLILRFCDSAIYLFIFSGEIVYLFNIGKAAGVHCLLKISVTTVFVIMNTLFCNLL